MAHFAEIIDGKVSSVIVIRDSNCGGGDFPESEEVGQSFIASLGLKGDWIQTSYNSNFRGKFAGVGMSYSEELDCFHSESPFPSWVLDSNGDWSAPTSYPDGGGKYQWNEDSKEWDAVN